MNFILCIMGFAIIWLLLPIFIEASTGVFGPMMQSLTIVYIAASLIFLQYVEEFL